MLPLAHGLEEIAGSLERERDASRYRPHSPLL